MKTIVKLTLISLLLLPALTGQAAITVTNISTDCYSDHSMFLKSDGSLWVMGDNQYGELGDGTTNNSDVPEQIVASNVTAIAAGGFYSLFVKTDGSLWAMGWKNLGELGDGSDSFYVITNRPEEILSSGVLSVAAGAFHSFFIKTNGSLWAMGSDNDGQLGDDGPINTDVTRPKQILASNVTAVVAGLYHSLILKSDGSLWAMGLNYYGELGDGPVYSTNVPVEIESSNVTAISAGAYHSLFVKSDGSLWAMGWNNLGELGDGGSTAETNEPELIVPNGVTTVAAGDDYSLFLKSDGSLWGMGDNYTGNLANGTIETTPTVPIPGPTSGVTSIAAGSAHCLFLKSDGSLWASGGDGYGQLGDGFNINIPFPATGTPEQIYPPPQPVMDSPAVSPTNLQVSATCGFGGNYRLLGSTNLALALNQWTPLGTNAVTLRGPDNFSVTLTNAINLQGQQFYILQSQ